MAETIGTVKDERAKLPAGSNAQKAFDAALDGTKRIVARELAKNKELIAFALDIEAAALTPKVIAQMAIDWVDKEELIIAGATYNRGTIKDKLTQKAATLPGFVKKLAPRLGFDLSSPDKIGESVDKILPTSRTFATAPAILGSEVVKYEKAQEEEGFFGKIGKVFSWLFQDFGGLLERIGELFTWGFSSGFAIAKAPDSLKEYFGKEAGGEISANFGARMRAEAKNRPDLAAFSAGIPAMEEEARKGVVDAAMGKPGAPLTAEGLAAELEKVKSGVVTLSDGRMFNPGLIKQQASWMIANELNSFLNSSPDSAEWKAIAQQVNGAAQDKLTAFKVEGVVDAGRTVLAAVSGPKTVQSKIKEDLDPKVGAISTVAAEGLWQGVKHMPEGLIDGTALDIGKHFGKAARKALEDNKQWSEGLDPKLREAVIKQTEEKVAAKIEAELKKDSLHDQLKQNKGLMMPFLKQLQSSPTAAAPTESEAALAAAMKKGTRSAPQSPESSRENLSYLPTPLSNRAQPQPVVGFSPGT